MSDDEEQQFADAIETSLFDDEPAPTPSTPTEPPPAPQAAARAEAPRLQPDFLAGDGEDQDGEEEAPAMTAAGAVGSVVRTVVAAGAGAVGRRLLGSGAEAQSGAGQEGQISTSEVSIEGGADAQPWMLVELQQNDAQAAMSARWATKATSFHALERWERERVAEYKKTAAQHMRTLELLQRQTAAGREEQLEAVTFFTQRAAADAAYAASITKQKLGGRPVSELSNLRGTLSAAKAEAKGEAGGADAGASAALLDVSGVVAVSAVMSVLGCMMLQAGDRLHKFAESDALQKDLAASHTAYAAAVEKVVSGLAQTLDELRRLDRACADAFGAHRAAFEQLQKGEAAAAAAVELPLRDLWISEFAYRSSLLGYADRMWHAGGAVREALERFRAAEHRRLGALHGALRVFVSLQQRLWADISASTSSVHGIFKDLPASTGLADQPASVSLERLTATAALAEYVARPPPPASLLIVYEGRLTYQRTLLRTWVGCYGVLTRDLFLHCFSYKEGEEPVSSTTLRAEQLLFSVRCAASRPSLGSAEQHAFEVLTSSASGLLGKVGIGTASTPLHLRAESAEALAGWVKGLSPTAVEPAGAPPPSES